MKTGKLIVFEGADEVGKTTLASMLFEALLSRGCKCELIGFPGNNVGTLGRHIYELHHEPKRFQVEDINPVSLQLLHVAAHIDAIDREVIPALRKNHTVILDRYWWSTWVYGITGKANKTSLRAAINTETIHWKGISPFRVFLVTRSLPLEQQKDISRWRQVSEFYRRFASREKRKYPVSVIKNEATPDVAFAQLAKCLKISDKLLQ